MANKKLEVNVQHIIKDIEAGKFTSFQSILNETGGQHIYEAVNEELRKYLKENNAVMISATQLAHLRETGYKDFESERKALETQLKTATGDLKKQIEGKLKDLKKFQYYSERKAPIGDELHKILELTDKGLVDLSDAAKAASQIIEQMKIDPKSNEKLKTLVGKTSADTAKNFRRAIKNAQDFQKMKVSAGMIGGETETARSMAFKKDGKLYVISGSTDWTKAKEGKIGDYKTTASFSAMHNLIQSVVNATLIRAQEGADLPITSKVAHLPLTAGRMKYSNTLPGVYNIDVGSYQEGVRLISNLIDVLEGRKAFTDVKIPGSVQGIAERGSYTYKNEIKEAMYYNGKPIGKWVGQTVEEVKSLLDSLKPQQRQQFLGSLFGETDGKPWYNTENAKVLKEAFRQMYQPQSFKSTSYETYGGKSLTGWAKEFETATGADRDKLADALSKELQEVIGFHEQTEEEISVFKKYSDALDKKDAIIKKFSEDLDDEDEVSESRLWGKLSAEQSRAALIKAYRPFVSEKVKPGAVENISAKLYYGQGEYYSEEFIKAIEARIPEIERRMREIGDEEIDKIRAGYLSGLSADEKIGISKDDMYEPDVFELDRLKDEYYEEQGISPTRIDMRGQNKELSETQATSLGWRILRIVDFAKNLDLALDEISKTINKPAEDIKAFLFQETPYAKIRYERSKEFSKTFEPTFSPDQMANWMKENFSSLFSEEQSILEIFENLKEHGTARGKRITSDGIEISTPSLLQMFYGVLEGDERTFDKTRAKRGSKYIYGLLDDPYALGSLGEEYLGIKGDEDEYFVQKAEQKALGKTKEIEPTLIEKVMSLDEEFELVRSLLSERGVESKQIEKLFDSFKKLIKEEPEYVSGGLRDIIENIQYESGKYGLTWSENLKAPQKILKILAGEKFQEAFDIAHYEKETAAKEVAKDIVDDALSSINEYSAVDIDKKELIQAAALSVFEKQKKVDEPLEEEIARFAENQKGLSVGDVTKKDIEATTNSTKATEDLTKVLEKKTDTKLITNQLALNNIAPGNISTVQSPSGPLDVYATSVDIADLSKAKATSITTDYEGHTIGKTYKYLNDKVFADYGPGGLQAWIQKWKDQDMQMAQAELIGILTKVPSYKKSSGGLSKAGRTAMDEILTDTFGDKYQPQQGLGAILNETKGIHKDTTDIKNLLSPILNGGGPISSFNSIDWNGFQQWFESTSAAGGSGGGGDNGKKPPKSGGRKGKSDEEKAAEKAQAEVEKQQKRDIKDYQQYVNKVVSLESQIDKLQKQAALSTGKHREAIYGAIDALNEEIGDLNRNNEALVKRVSTEQEATKASIDSTAALKKETNAQKNLVGVKGATSIWDMMANDIQRATMRIADFGVAAKLLNKIPQDVQKIIQYTKELDKVMTDIRIVTGATADEVKDMMRDYGNTARELGVTLTEVGTSASEWMRQGYEGAEVLDLIESSTKLATLGFMSQTDATKSLTAMMKSFNIAANDTIDIVDKLTKLDQVSAISAGELAEGISRVATTAQQAGLSIDQTAAAISVLTEQTQRDAGSMGDALRTIIVRFQNVKAGVYSSMDETSGESSELTENLSDVEKVLSKVGIRVRNSAYEFRNIYDVLDELAAKWDTLDSVTKSAIGGAFAGQRQREQFNILISQWERVKELTEESEKSAGTADQKYTAYMDSMEAATKRLQNAWESFTQSLETSPIIKTLTNATALLVENADKLKYLAIALAVAQSSKIFNFFDPNSGEVGGIKGLIANIPILGTGTKTNNLLESLDMNVKAMRGTQEREAGIQAKERKRGGNLLKNAFGFGDIYDPKTGTSISRKTLSLYKKSQSGKIDLTKNWLGYTANLSDDEREFLRLAATVKREDAQGQMEEYNKLLQKRKGQNAAVGVAAALIAGAASNKNVDSGMLAGLINKTGETMQETEEGKAWRIGNSTIAAGIMGYFLGPIGAQIGALLGDEFASLTSTLYHLSDLERMQRTTIAKEQLQTLESIESISEKGNQIMSERFLDSSGYEQLNKYVENLVSELGKLDTAVSDKILRAIRDTGKTAAATISQLGDDILNASPEDRKEIQAALNIATMEQAYNQLVASQESERMDLATLKMKSPVVLISGQHYDKILKKYGTYDEEASGMAGGIRSARSFSPFGATLEERLKNAQEAYEEFGVENRAFEDFIGELKQAIETERQMDRELRNSQIQVAYLKSGISDLTQNELADLTIDGVAGKVVGSLESMGVEVRDTSNAIKSEYLTQIKSMIRADSDMAILTKGDAKRIGELEAAWSEFVSVFGDAADAYEKAKEALDTGTFEEYLSEHNIQGDADALEKLVYAANPERIEQFASAWNMTTEAAKELAKIMPNLTTAMGLMSTTEISEKMSKIATIFSDLSEDGKLTVENFNAILKNYPEYINQLGDYEALIGSLGKTLTDESLIAYKNALLTTLMGDEGYYKKFKEQLPEELSKLLTGTNAKTLTDVLDLAQTNDDFAALNGELEKFLNQTYELEIDNPLRDLAIEVKEGLLDKQISNLNEQKDALSQINDERKKELEYIKAKIALEDAQKEKKRVYVQNVGWTYRVDETAVSEAKEKLDSLDIERQQSAIQLQIDSLEQQKEILEAIKNNEQLEKIEKALGEGGISTDVDQIAQMISSIEFNPMTGQFQMFAASEEQKREKALEALKTSNTAYEKAVDVMNKEWDSASIERQQELYDTVRRKYEEYSTAYSTASGLGADVSDYSENGKIKQNAAEGKKLTRAKFIENVAGFKSGSSNVSFQFDGVDYSNVKIEENELSGSAHNQLNQVVKELTGRNKEIGDLVYLNGHLYIRRRDGGWGVLADDTAANQVRAKYFLAKGSLSSQGGLTMLNEFGTEGIITPQGTLTALPSKTGVVPADITKNVWALGEVAPTLVASLKSLTQKPLSGNAGNTTYEEGQYIDNLTMNVYPTKDYDMDKLLREARAKANLTKHNN